MTETKKIASQIAYAAATGAAWGRQEVQAWIDNADDASTPPEWTPGTYCGDLEKFDYLLPDTAERIIDDAAESVWNLAFDF